MKHTYKKYLAIFGTTLIALSIVGGSQLLYAQSPDALNPSDVENLQAVASDGEITLSWDPATDNVGVTDYKIFIGTNPVKSSEDSYNLPSTSTGNVTNYTVKNLTNGQTYYFSAAAKRRGKQ